MIDKLKEYRLQSLFGVLQAVVIAYGILFTGATMKMYGYPESDQIWKTHALFVRHCGVLLLAVPLIWVWATIHWERTRSDFTKRATLITGLCLLLGLLWFLGRAAMSPARGVVTL